MKKFKVLEDVECDFKDGTAMQEIYENENEAITAAKEYFNHLTDTEKSRIEYFCVTEIEIPDGMEVDDIVDFGELLDNGNTVWQYDKAN